MAHIFIRERSLQFVMIQIAKIQKRLNKVGIGILVLTLITASAHIYMGFQLDEALHTLFLLNGLGYLALLTAFFLFQQSLVRWVLLGYTSLTIMLWFLLSGPVAGSIDPFDLVVKTVEGALVILLFIDGRRNRNRFTR